MKGRQDNIAIAAYLDPFQVPRPADWPEIFGRTAPIHLEIGSGLGEYLVGLAARNRDCDVVGIEYDRKRVKKTLNRVHLCNRNQPNPLTNIRVMPLDARVVLERYFQPRAVTRIYCLFPCPWPKESHAKHRLFSRNFLRLVNSRLAEGGTLQLVTDYRPYVEWIREEAKETGFRWDERLIPPTFETKFEKKWRAEGQSVFHELLFYKTAHQDVPLKGDTELQVYAFDHFDPARFECPDVTGETSVIFKEFLFDAQRNKGMLRLVVAEEDMTQQAWLSIDRKNGRWFLRKADGHTLLPTPGVAFALQHVHAQASGRTGPEGGAPPV